MHKIVATSAVALSLALPVTAPTAAQAEYPEQPVEFVVPFPPGDLEDVLTRMIAEQFQETYGVPAAVVNKPGGGGGPFPGAAEVAMAGSDGYTIGSFVIGVPLIGPEVGIPALDPNPFEPVLPKSPTGLRVRVDTGPGSGRPRWSCAGGRRCGSRGRGAAARPA